MSPLGEGILRDRQLSGKGAYDEEVLGWPDEITEEPLLVWEKDLVNIIVWNSYWGAYSTTVFSVDDTAPSQDAGKTGDPVPI